MIILICNAGSTSLKFKLWEMPAARVLARGRVERVGAENAVFHYAAGGAEEMRGGLKIADYRAGIALFLNRMLAPGGPIASLRAIGAVGFKTVLAKGYTGTHRIDEGVLDGMRAFLNVAPAHNGPYLEAIGVFRELMPDTPLVGAFETAFHQTIPKERALFSIPWAWTEKYALRRMGYHGASHAYIAERTGGKGRVISCHLGGSGSLCAIRDGKSVDNSFGLSLQAGPMHNNRTGDLDAYVIFYLLDQGLSREEIDRGLKTDGGLKGVSGVSGDLRDIESVMDAGNARAKLAFDMYVEALCHYAGAYYVELGGLDQLVFTGGIGENSPRLRKALCEKLGCLGVKLDEAKNNAGDAERVISAPDSPVTVRVIPADEEWMVVRETYRNVSGEI